PQELYDHPAKAFVAGFLGTANILNGRIEDSPFITAGGQRLRVANPVPSASRIVLRPQNIRLHAGYGDFPRKMADREFLASQIRYLVDTADGQIIVDTLHSTGAPPHGPGAPVYISIDSHSAPLLND